VRCKQAGAIAGISVNLLVFPLDTLKTRFQSLSYQQTYRSATAIAERALWRNLYQGVGTVVLVAVPSSGVFFTTYEGLKSVLGGSSLPQPAVYALSSCIAQLANCAVVAPAEVLKQNAQTLASVPGSPVGGKRKGASSPTMTVLRQLRRHPTKLWRGYSALVARDLPFTALQFPAFEYLKEVIMARRSKMKKDGDPVGGVFERSWIAAVSAGVAGSAAAWVTTPFDVIKTRMMLQAGAEDERVDCSVNGRRSAKSDFVGRRCAKSGFRVGAEVLQRDGVQGLFRGASVRAALTILGNGLYMGCYEGAKLYLLGENEDC
jgi:hypothetical protein